MASSRDFRSSPAQQARFLVGRVQQMRSALGPEVRWTAPVLALPTPALVLAHWLSELDHFR